jgi:hypothetical protein
MHEELHQFTQSDVWTLVPRPVDQNVIGTRWIFKNKSYENGNGCEEQGKVGGPRVHPS